jgi:hypothetical protein
MVTFLMYVEKYFLHVAQFSSWHSDSQLKRYSGKPEIISIQDYKMWTNELSTQERVCNLNCFDLRVEKKINSFF